MSTESSFALIGHPTSVQGIRSYLSFLGRSRPEGDLGDELLKKLFEWTPAFKALDLTFTSKASNATVSGSLVISTFLPEMLLTNRRKVVAKVEEAVRLSETLGATVGALGGFTSIADDASGAVVARQASTTRLTNGTAATSILTIEGVKTLCAWTELDLTDAVVAIVGATGSIGRTCASWFRGVARKLILTGRNPRKLSASFGSWQGGNSSIALTTDNALAIRQADVVVFVTSATRPVCTEDAFKAGALVCDVGYPKNVVSANEQRDDIILYAGGLARPPSEIKCKSVLGLPADDMIYGCFAEAIAFAMGGHLEGCSSGSADVSRETLNTVRKALFEHGFTLPPFMNTRKTYSARDFARIREIRRTAATSAAAV
jgi:predicted amino acid dehydrogenase